MSDFPIDQRLLGAEDAMQVQRLLESNPDYTQRVEGDMPTASAAMEVLTTLPPQTSLNQKKDLGLFLDGDLLALADLIVGWPQATIAHVGLLMTHGKRHRQGLGRAVHQSVIEFLVQFPEIDTLRISIVDSNADAAQPFWSALGYEPTGEFSDYQAGTVKSTARVWARSLK